MIFEVLDIKSYLDAHHADDYEQFKRNIRMDLERRRDENCPPQESKFNVQSSKFGSSQNIWVMRSMI